MIMNLIRSFIENFAHPRGLLGRVVAWRLDISNRLSNDWTLSLLDIQPSDHVLEVGFGSGLTLKIAAGKTPTGFVAGVDSSSTMLKIAQKRNAQFIATGRLELKLGETETLPYEDHQFDKVYAVQVINYLADPIKGFKELYRVTKPGGRVALFFEAKEKYINIQDLIEGIYHPYDASEVITMLREAGFSHAWIETKDFIARKVHYIGHVALGEKEPGKLKKNTNA
jgi:ubiquinone/menaquinone biosynthesis C-methylase UbiE